MAVGIDKRLGKYLLKSQLGKGGMGVVYLARDERLQRDVALKLLPRQMSQNPEAVQRFLQEARAIARLHHPNVVTVHDVDEELGYCFLVMELLTGGTIQTQLKQGPLPCDEATAIMAQVCKGLAAAHAVGILHRDIKPANIMRNAAGIIKLTDFGLAKFTDQETGISPLTKTGTILGTPQYMSPEQCRGEALDERSDIYSLGATYFDLLVGKPPFSDPQPLQVMFAHCSKPAPDPCQLRPNLPAACGAIVRKALAKNRADRFATASAMLAALEKVASDAPRIARAEPPRIARPPSATEELPATIPIRAPLIHPRRSRKWLAWASGLCALLLAVAWGWGRWGTAPAANGELAAGRNLLHAWEEIPMGEAVVRGAAFNLEGDSIYVGFFTGGVQQWDLKTKRLARTYEGTKDKILALAADSRWLAAGGHGKTVWLWKLNQPQPHETLADFAGEISSLAISPDGKRLAVGTYAETVLYELSELGARRLKVLGTSSTNPLTCYMVMGVAFSSDSRFLAGTTWTEKKIAVWDAVTGNLLQTSPSQVDNPMAVAFVPGQARLIFGLHHHGLHVWDFKKSPPKALLPSANTEVRALVLAPDGTAVFAVGEWGGRIRGYHLVQNRALRLDAKETGTSSNTMAITPDGQRLIVGGGDENQRRGFLHLWKLLPDKPE